MDVVSNHLAIVGVYAALNAIIMMTLGFMTGQLRRKYKVSVGDGGVPHMVRIMRGHANATENIPIMMIMMVIAAGIGTPAGVLHGLGIVYTFGRAVHAWHFMQESAPFKTRMIGFGVGDPRTDGPRPGPALARRPLLLRA